MPDSECHPIAQIRICKGIRFAGLGETFVLFIPSTGRYITLKGGAADSWRSLISGDTSADAAFELGHYSQAFVSLGLVQGTGRATGLQPQNSPSHEITKHTSFDSLVLDDPGLEIPLLGTLGHVNLPPSNQRHLLERYRVRTFVESLIQEGDEYADRHEMISLQVELFGSSIEMRIPQSDDTLPISLSQGFMRSTRAASGEADFIITCIDDSIGDRRTQAYFEKDWHLPLGLIDRQLTGDRRVAIDRHSQTVSVFDPRTRRCVVWTKLLADLPYWSAATPFRLQLSWICDVVGLEFLHSAAVSSFGKATLFAGPSGSGKSTIALLLAQLGFPLIADDFLVASPDAVQGVYTRVKVHDNYLRQTVNEDWKILNPEAISQKRIVETIDAITDEVIPIRCIIVPTIGQELGLEPLDAGDALSAIAPASLSGLLGGNDRSLNRIATLVSAFPCFRLGLDQSVFTDERGSRRIVEELQKLVS